MAAGLGGYSSIGEAVMKMWREEGIRGFYKGLYPNLLKVPSPLAHNVPELLLLIFLRSPAYGSKLIVVGRSEYGSKLVHLRIRPRPP